MTELKVNDERAGKISRYCMDSRKPTTKAIYDLLEDRETLLKRIEKIRDMLSIPCDERLTLDQTMEIREQCMDILKSAGRM